MAKPPKEIVEKMLNVVRRNREKILSSPATRVARVELGRRLWFTRHCGVRMYQVKVFYTYANGDAHDREWRGADEHVCLHPGCLYHYVNRDW